MFHNIKTEQDIADDMMDKIRDLLIEHDQLPESDVIQLSVSQKHAFERFKLGDNLLIIGAGGCGKSKLVKEFYRYIKKNEPNKTMYITSTTGISAYNIGGITINSFMGIGTGQASTQTLLKRLRFKIGIKDRIRNTDILVIDEMSMLSASIFEKINVICQTLRKSRLPFGGIQIILTGDPLQLETIFNTGIGIDESNQDNRLIIESELFKQLFKKSIVNLKENFRQRGDNDYIDILMRIRKAEHTEDDIKILQSRLTKDTNSETVHLVSSNKKAQMINSLQLNKIKADDFFYECDYTKIGDIETCDLLEKELRSQFMQRGNDTLQLRKGCRVLLIKNLDVSKGLVNGSTGTITDLMKNAVQIKFDNDVTELIGRSEWELELDNARVTCTQIPIILAYSITIHKSQSLSLDSAILDLADCFCNHMVYVALSRVRTLNGIFLKSFNPNKITVNEKLLEYVNQFGK